MMSKYYNPNLFLKVNIALLLFFAGLFIITKLEDKAFGSMMAYFIISVISTLFHAGMFAGLSITLNSYGESVIAIIAIASLFLFEVFTSLLPFVFSSLMFSFWLPWLHVAIMSFVGLALCMVREATIRNYYRLFALSLILVFLLKRCIPLLYDSFGVFWISINPLLLSMIPFFVTLALFLQLTRSQKTPTSLQDDK